MDNLLQNSDYLQLQAEVEKAVQERKEGLVRIAPEHLRYSQGFIEGMRYVNDFVREE